MHRRDFCPVSICGQHGDVLFTSGNIRRQLRLRLGISPANGLSRNTLMEYPPGDKPLLRQLAGARQIQHGEYCGGGVIWMALKMWPSTSRINIPRTSVATLRSYRL